MLQIQAGLDITALQLTNIIALFQHIVNPTPAGPGIISFCEKTNKPFISLRIHTYAFCHIYLAVYQNMSVSSQKLHTSSSVDITPILISMLSPTRVNTTPRVHKPITALVIKHTLPTRFLTADLSASYLSKSHNKLSSSTIVYDCKATSQQTIY